MHDGDGHLINSRHVGGRWPVCGARWGKQGYHCVLFSNAVLMVHSDLCDHLPITGIFITVVGFGGCRRRGRRSRLRPMPGGASPGERERDDERWKVLG